MRRRIMLFAGSTALFAVVVLAIPLGVLVSRSYLRDERLELQQAAAIAAARAGGDVTRRDWPGIDQREIKVSIYDTSGRLLTGPGPRHGSQLVYDALHGDQPSTTQNDAILVATPVIGGSRPVAVLLLSTSLDAVHRQTRNSWFILAAMCVGAVALATLAAGLLAKRLTRPIDRLASVADRVGAGDLSARTTASGVREIDRLGITLNNTVERVRSMLESERGLSVEISHQLRTPLASVRLDLEAARGLSPVSPAAVRVASALKQVDRLEATITDVIALARDLPTGETVAVGKLLESVVGRWESQLARARRELRVNIHVDSGRAFGISEAAATQILDILIDNACRHGAGAITVAVRTRGTTTTLDVCDEGPPLVAEAHELFGAREPRAEHGIGLPYARRLAEAEGARLILASSSPPTFRLLTPSARAGH